MNENSPQAQKLRDMDSALLSRLDRMKGMVEGGDYSAAIISARNLEDDLRETNNFANLLAELDD